MKWRTITEVAKILLDNATVTQAKCTAAVEAARAICCVWLEVEAIALILMQISSRLQQKHNKEEKQNER